jgi:hypothetical protein
MAVIMVETSSGKHTFAEVSDKMGETAINYLSSIAKAYKHDVDVCQEFEAGVFLCGAERDARIAEEKNRND